MIGFLQGGLLRTLLHWEHQGIEEMKAMHEKDVIMKDDKRWLDDKNDRKHKSLLVHTKQ